MKKSEKLELKIQQLEKDLNNFKTAVTELKVLNEIAVAAGSAVNVDQTLKSILNKTVDAINAEHGAILLVSENNELLKHSLSRKKIVKLVKNRLSGNI